MKKRSIPWCMALLSVLVSCEVLASISLSATRVVFDGARKEANVTVRNGGQNVLVQSWIDTDQPDNKSLPFAITPPLARVLANQQQLLRILYEGAGMPLDKESVVWLNVQEIPQSGAADVNTLQLAVRQRIKVFFRPENLPGDAAQAPAQLQWRVQKEAGRSQLKVINPALYHVSLADLKLGLVDKAELVVGATMIAPGEELIFNLKTAPSSPALRFSIINDYGALQYFEATLTDREQSWATATAVKEQ